MARALSNLGKAVLQQKAFSQQTAQGIIAVAGNKNCEHTFICIIYEIKKWIGGDGIRNTWDALQKQMFVPVPSLIVSMKL